MMFLFNRLHIIILRKSGAFGMRGRRTAPFYGVDRQPQLADRNDEELSFFFVSVWQQTPRSNADEGVLPS